MTQTERLNRPKLGITLILLAMLVFATQDAVTKHLAASYSAPQLLWIRYVIYTVFALLLVRRERPIKTAFKSQKPVLQLIRSALILCEIGVFIMAIRYLSLAEIHSLFAIYPLMAMALAAFALGEKVGIHRWASVVVGLIGVLIILRPGTGAIDPSALLALACAAMFAVYQVMTRFIASYDDSATSTLYMAVVGLVIMTVVGPFYWEPVAAADWKFLISLGVSASVGHFLLIKSLECAPAVTLQPFNFSFLLFAAILGYVVFDNVPDQWTVIGAVVIVVSGLYAIHREKIKAGV